MSDKKTRRLEQIKQILNEKPYISVKELSEELDISEMTVRRDVKEIQKLDHIDMVNGVIIKSTPVEDDKYDIFIAETRCEAEKRRIGKFAATLIEHGDVIALDVGTTTEKIAEYLPTDKDITVICYSLNILYKVRMKGISKIVFGGGYFRESSQTFESPEATNLIRRYRINKAFLSAAGVSLKLGVTCVNGYEPPLKRAVIESTLEKILVFDSSKLEQVKAAYFANLEEFDTIITDDQVVINEKDYSYENKIKLYRV